MANYLIFLVFRLNIILKVSNWLNLITLWDSMVYSKYVDMYIVSKEYGMYFTYNIAFYEVSCVLWKI